MCEDVDELMTAGLSYSFVFGLPFSFNVLSGQIHLNPFAVSRRATYSHTHAKAEMAYQCKTCSSVVLTVLFSDLSPVMTY